MFEFLWLSMVVIGCSIAAIQLVVAAPLVVKKMGPLGLVFIATAGIEMYRGFDAAIHFNIWALSGPLLIGAAAQATRHWMTR